MRKKTSGVVWGVAATREMHGGNLRPSAITLARIVLIQRHVRAKQKRKAEAAAAVPAPGASAVVQDESDEEEAPMLMATKSTRKLREQLRETRPALFTSARST